MSPKKENVGVDLGLTEEERNELHQIAQTVIERKSRGESVPTFSPSSEKLKEGRGAFVCVYKKGMLRGCIGSLEGDTPLYRTVEEMAQAAAFRDPRFRPVTPDELPYLNLEISVLTPLQKTRNFHSERLPFRASAASGGYRKGLGPHDISTGNLQESRITDGCLERKRCRDICFLSRCVLIVFRLLHFFPADWIRLLRYIWCNVRALK
jgi:hypothetical protein